MRGRFAALVTLSVVGGLLLFAWLRWRVRWVLALGFASAVCALAAGTSIGWQVRSETRYPHAVVVGEDVHLRLGRGEGSDLALKQSLGPGVELRILGQRADWVEVRLGNGETGWLPAVAVERV